MNGQAAQPPAALPTMGAVGLRGRLGSHLRVPMYREAYALILSGVITSLVGVAYWVVAAHSYTADVVGLNSAAISAMMLLSGVAQLNLSSALMRFIPVTGRTTFRLILVSYLTSVLVAAVLGTAFLVGTRRWLPSLHAVSETTGLAVFFVFSTMAWCIFTLQDAVLTGLRRAVWVPVENAAFSLAKLVLLVALAGVFPRWGIFASWTTALVVSLVPVTALIFGRLIFQHVAATAERAAPPSLRQLTRFVAPDYLGALCWLASVTVVPIIVTQRAGPAENAYFSLAWVIVVPLFLVGASMGSSLVVSAVSERGALPRYLPRMLVQTAVLVLPAVAVLEALAPYILRIFGNAYSEHGSTVLRLLALSAVPNVVSTLYVSAARVRRRMSTVVAILAAQCIGVLGLSWVLLGPYGIEGVGWAWLVAQSVVAATLVIRAIPNLWSEALRGGLGGRLTGAVRIANDLGLLPHLQRWRDAIERRKQLGPYKATAVEVLRSLPELTGASRLQPVQARRLAPTASDTVVMCADLGSEGAAAVKLPRTSGGSQSLRREIEVLRTLSGDPRLGDWSAMLPRVVAAGEVDGRPFLVETLVPGFDVRGLVKDVSRRAVIQVCAAAAIGELHRLTAAPRVVDGDLLQVWVDRPLLALALVEKYVGAAALERVAAELRSSFAGRRLSLSWIHGDFVPGNVIAVADGSSVTAILDWDRAKPVDLPLLDPLQFLLATRALVTGRELGSVVLELLDGASFDQDEQALLARSQTALPGDAVDMRAAVLLCWLRHVSANLEKSARYARHFLWLRGNVLSVLERVAR